MAGTWKHQYIFAAGQSGWSETWYSQVSSLLADAHAAFGATVPARQGLCGAFTKVVAYRTSSVVPPRAFKLTRLPNFPPINAPQAGEIRDTSWNCVHLRIRTADQVYARAMELRGVPDDWIAFGANAQPAIVPAMDTAMDAWIAAVTVPALRLSWKGLFKSGEGNNPLIRISGLTAPALGRITYVCSVGHGLFVNDFCTIQGLKGVNLRRLPPAIGDVNGIRQVTGTPDDFTFTTDLFSVQFPLAPTLQTFGTVRRRDYTFPIVAGWDFMSFSRRQTGRPFFLPLGHRRKARYG